MATMAGVQPPLLQAIVQTSSCTGFTGTHRAPPAKVPCHPSFLLCVDIRAADILCAMAPGIECRLWGCADLVAAAGRMRQAVSDTFVCLADSWEMAKKFSGAYRVPLLTSLAS